MYGGFGDCTAFQVKGSNYSVYGPMLTNVGFSSTGKQILYNGMTGTQIESDIFIGPTYYMRLKHMVKDKINYRARGPNTNLTRQPVQGRANDGGLRIGEMERDGVLAHGMSYFLNESFMIRGDEYNIAVCNKTGAVSVYNNGKNLFFSLFADGPIRFHTNPNGDLNVKNISKFGRSFSILRIPYSLKLLIQELAVLNVQMRIITDNNVDQLLNMSYSNNITKLLKLEESKDKNEDKEIITFEMYNELYKKYLEYKNNAGPALDVEEYKIIQKNRFEEKPNLVLLNKSVEQNSIEKIIDKYIQDIKRNNAKQKTIQIPDETPEMPLNEMQEVSIDSLSFPEEIKDDNYSPDYAPASPASNQGMNINININSKPAESNQGINIDVPVSPDYAPVSPDYAPASPATNQGITQQEQQPEEKEKESILNIDPEPKPEEKEPDDSSNDSKKIIISPEDSSTNSDVKKINI
jgi:DNA-directed RNA polymerase beta subunit